MATLMTQLTKYMQFLRGKIPQAEETGFEPMSAPHESLFPHQVDLATWACKGGRRAVFANFGLGKTRIHLQIAKWICEKTEGRFLIVAPLGVRQEFTKVEGPAMGMQLEYVRTNKEILESPCRVLITNYERVRDGDIDLSQFSGAGLDESSVLRSFGSKTYQQFLRSFREVKYRFVFTATPSPNRHKELIHYAGFLGIMDTGDALTRFFQRDSTQANNLTLYPHMERQFWLWLGSWAVFMQRPSDLGYSDAGYDLPPITVTWHKVEVDNREAWKQFDGWGQAQLFQDQAQGLKQSAESRRNSVSLRIERAKQIIEEGGAEKHWLLWHDLEKEREVIQKEIPEAVTVYGSQDLEVREGKILGFANGDYRILATKPIIAGSGCNFQRHCHDAIFLGVGYKFNDFIQAIHRIHRFQQGNQVNIHIIYLDSESTIRDALETKWQLHEALMLTMRDILKTYKLSNNSTMELLRSLGTERAEVKTDTFRAIHNDTVLELMPPIGKKGKIEAASGDWPDDCVDMILTSIPFGTQYEYSPSYHDMGHNAGNAEFFQQMSFLVPNLLRVLKPGRVAAIHVKDRIRFGNVTGTGFPTVEPFSDHTTKAFIDGGFHLMARITIDTDVVRENNQTYRLGWSENAKDSSKMGAGMPEYVLIFRKLPTDTSDGYADNPVMKSKAEYTRADWQIDAAGLWRSNGNRLPDPELMKFMNVEELKRLWIQHSTSGAYSHEQHVELAKALEGLGKLPASFMLFPPVSRHKDIWTDICRMLTLNAEQSRRQKEMHMCPLQLDVIKRLITRYTNEGEMVFDPFAGIFSVPYQALHMKRKAVGCELHKEYWRCGVGYCEMAASEAFAPTLFDLGEIGNAEPNELEAAD